MNEQEKVSNTEGQDRHTLGAFAIVLDSQDRVLLSHRRDMDLWNLPGGRVEAGELPSGTVTREVMEETGLEARILRLVGVYSRADKKPDLVFAFECRTNGTPILTDEADQHEWFKFDDIPINTSPKQVARVQDTLERHPTPLFKTQNEPSSRDWLKTIEDTEIVDSHSWRALVAHRPQ